MNYNQRLKELRDEIRHIKVKQHNNGMNGMAEQFQKKLNLSEIEAENKFYEILKRRNYTLKDNTE